MGESAEAIWLGWRSRAVSITLAVVAMLGRRAGIVVAIVTVLTTGVFVALAYAGVVGRWFTIHRNPTDGNFWLLQSSTWLMALVPGLVLCERRSWPGS